MNVPRDLDGRLKAKGHECRHVGDIGMAQASDAAIVDEARRNREVIVTHDLDYGRLVGFCAEPPASVVILRLRNSHPDNLFSRLMKTLIDIEKPLLDGAVVVVEDAALRIRRLPFAQDERQQKTDQN